MTPPDDDRPETCPLCGGDPAVTASSIGKTDDHEHRRCHAHEARRGR